MANEMIRVFGTQKTLEANGGSITNASIVQANDASYTAASDGADYPDALFVLGFTFASTPTEGTVLQLVARLLNMDGTNDAEVPEASRADRLIGNFIVNNVTTAQYAELYARNVPRDADYYIFNNGTGQTVSSGWTLKVTPVSRKPA